MTEHEFIETTFGNHIRELQLSYDEAKKLVENFPDSNLHLSKQIFLDIINKLDNT